MTHVLHLNHMGVSMSNILPMLNKEVLEWLVAIAAHHPTKWILMRPTDAIQILASMGFNPDGTPVELPEVERQ